MRLGGEKCPLFSEITPRTKKRAGSLEWGTRDVAWCRKKDSSLSFLPESYSQEWVNYCLSCKSDELEGV